MDVEFSDNAETYVAYVSEEFVDEIITPFKIKLCSKFGFDSINRKLTGVLNSQPKHIREVVDQSLNQIRPNRIDLL